MCPAVSQELYLNYLICIIPYDGELLTRTTYIKVDLSVTGILEALSLLGTSSLPLKICLESTLTGQVHGGP